ncbi:hypothetical protein N8076_00100 [Gammaproteobacteria bacterium]|nr:hypothetical protein [Gammaproteobacteria bacterium]
MREILTYIPGKFRDEDYIIGSEAELTSEVLAKLYEGESGASLRHTHSLYFPIFEPNRIKFNIEHLSKKISRKLCLPSEKEEMATRFYIEGSVTNAPELSGRGWLGPAFLNLRNSSFLEKSLSSFDFSIYSHGDESERTRVEFYNDNENCESSNKIRMFALIYLEKYFFEDIFSKINENSTITLIIDPYFYHFSPEPSNRIPFFLDGSNNNLIKPDFYNLANRRDPSIEKELINISSQFRYCDAELVLNI